MKTWESGGIAPPFLPSALDGGERSASRPSRSSPRENLLSGDSGRPDRNIEYSSSSRAIIAVGKIRPAEI
jgi:hypothetical protein